MIYIIIFLVTILFWLLNTEFCVKGGFCDYKLYGTRKYTEYYRCAKCRKEKKIEKSTLED